MKTNLLLVTLILCSCDLLGDGVGIGRSRRDENAVSKGSGDAVPSVSDTVLLLSGVSFPDSYDWHRDTSFGKVSSTIFLLRGKFCSDSISDLKRILEIPAGPGHGVSPDADGHHLIGGQLFTEYTDGAETCIGKNGQELFYFAGREKLLGLYPDGEGVWTLGRRYGGGFTLRRDGKAVFVSDNGSVFGGFSRPGYGETGALYRDDGKLCFSYLVNSGGKRYVYLVRDGIEKLLMTTSVAMPLDAKSCCGSDVTVCNYPGGTSMHVGQEVYDICCGGFLMWDSGGIVSVNGEPMFAGTFRYSESPGSVGGIGGRHMYLDLGENTTYIACSQDNAFGVGRWDTASLFYLGRGFDGIEFCSGVLEEPLNLYSQSCLALLGRTYWMAMSPKTDETGPCLVWPSGRIGVNINGFLSGVSVSVEEGG